MDGRLGGDARLVADLEAWLEGNDAPTPRELAAAGYVMPQWPRPWGVGADGGSQLVIEDQLRRAGITLPANPSGFSFVGPALLEGGTDTQLERYLPPMLDGSELWCRLYSEPDAGSDLASVRIRAERTGPSYVVTGQKIWAPLAESAVLAGLLVRTSGASGDADGLSYLVCPMDAPGIEVRRMRDMMGGSMFNEVFFDAVEIPVENLVGKEGDGFGLLTAPERHRGVSAARGASFGKGPGAEELIALARATGRTNDPVLRDQLSSLHVHGEVLRFLALTLASMPSGSSSTVRHAQLRKVLVERHGRDLARAAVDLRGVAGVARDGDPTPLGAAWNAIFLLSPALTIGAGAEELQLDQIAERLLGL